MAKKIYIQMSGRLGNQLFSYAFAKKIQLNVGGEILCNFYEVFRASKIYEDDSFNDAINAFTTDYKIIENLKFRKMVLKYGSPIQIILCYLFLFARKFWSFEDTNITINDWFSNFLSKHGLFITPTIVGRYETCASKQIFVFGKFENADYYIPIQNELQALFKPRGNLRSSALNTLELIKNTSSVCVTIRRGDYLATTFKNDFYQCDEDYFIKAVDVIKKRLANPTFFLFSDDLDYARSFATQFLSAEHYFVEEEGNSLSEKVALMKECKHFIISNSTFSWWAQFLGKSSDKIVIGPKHWFPPHGKVTNDLLTQDEWLKI